MTSSSTKNTHGKVLVASIKAAAAKMECSEGLLKKIKAKGADGFRANGSVCVDEVREWMQANQVAGGDKDEKLELECRRLIAQCEKLEHELAKARREVIARGEYIANNARAIAEFRAGLGSLEGDAPMWSGLPPHEIQKRVKARNHELLDALEKSFRRLADE